MLTIVIIAIAVLIFWIISDQFQKQAEIKSDSTLANGLKSKYPITLKSLNQMDFNILKETKTELVFKKVILKENLLCRMDLTYLPGHIIQCIIQTHSISPNRPLDMNTYNCSSALTDEEFQKKIHFNLLDFDRCITSINPNRLLGLVENTLEY